MKIMSLQKYHDTYGYDALKREDALAFTVWVLLFLPSLLFMVWHGAWMPINQDAFMFGGVAPMALLSIWGFLRGLGWQCLKTSRLGGSPS